MNRYEYKGYWSEIFLDCRGEEGDEIYFNVPYIEHPNEGGAEEIEDYVTYEEAKLGAEKYIDMLEAAPESEVNFICNEPEVSGVGTIGAKIMCCLPFFTY